MVYVEVFGGGGSVLLNKERSVREVLNDANGNLINLYRVVREHPDELKDRLLYVLHSREDFKIAQRRLAQFSYKDDILRAADFYQVVRQSYAGNGKQFSAVARSMWAGFPPSTGLPQAPRRHPGERRFRRYLPKVRFAHNRLLHRPALLFHGGLLPRQPFPAVQITSGWRPSCWAPAAGGCFLTTFARTVLELYQQPGILIEEVDRINNMAQRYEGGAIYKEVLISNYDTIKRTPEQLYLFAPQEPEERKILWNGLY